LALDRTVPGEYLLAIGDETGTVRIWRISDSALSVSQRDVTDRSFMAVRLPDRSEVIRQNQSPGTKESSEADGQNQSPDKKAPAVTRLAFDSHGHWLAAALGPLPKTPSDIAETETTVSEPPAARILLWRVQVSELISLACNAAQYTLGSEGSGFQDVMAQIKKEHEVDTCQSTLR
jgi:hypothetical protein